MNQTKSVSPIVYVCITLSIIFWGFSFIWTNQLIHTNTPIFSFIFFRMLSAGVILLLVSLFVKKLQRIDKKDVKWLFFMALFEPFIYFIGETFGLKATASPSLSAVIVATIPIFTMISGVCVYHEKVSGWNIFGILLTLPGVLFMVLDQGDFTPEYWWGIALLFLAVAASVGYSTTVKKLSAKYNSYTISTYQFLIGALYFLPFFLCNEASEFTLDFFRAEVLVPLLCLAVLCSAVAFILYIESIKRIGITKSSIFTSLIPAFTALGAYIMGQETFTPLQICGIAIVIAGVIITQHTKKA